MRRWALIGILAAPLCCSGEASSDLAVDILAVSPPEVQREGGETTISWQAEGSEPYYYSVSVGLERRLVASGRAAGGVRQTLVVGAGELDPCTNQVVVSVVAPGGAAGSDSEVVFLCPTPGCRGCRSEVPDGDADADVDVDADTDVDVDADGDADPCEPGSFPNGGSCDPVSGACCQGGTCEPDPFTSFAEACSFETGSGDLGDGCNSSYPCRPGLTCFNGLCSTYCSETGWDYDCPSGWRCYSFRVSVDGGPYLACPSYGICQPY